VHPSTRKGARAKGGNLRSWREVQMGEKQAALTAIALLA